MPVISTEEARDCAIQVPVLGVSGVSGTSTYDTSAVFVTGRIRNVLQSGFVNSSVERSESMLCSLSSSHESSNK